MLEGGEEALLLDLTWLLLRTEPIREGVAVNSSPILLSSSCRDACAELMADCSFCRRSRSFCGDCMRKRFAGEPVAAEVLVVWDLSD